MPVRGGGEQSQPDVIQLPLPNWQAPAILNESLKPYHLEETIVLCWNTIVYGTNPFSLLSIP